MGKNTEISKVLAVILLIVMTVGLGTYFTLRLATLTDNRPSGNLPVVVSDHPTLFGEQTSLQHALEHQLEQAITESIGQLTGPDSVRATVLVQLDLQHRQTRQLQPRDRLETIASDWTSLIHHLSVSVLVDGQMLPGQNGRTIYQPRTKNEMAQYTNLIKTIIGFNPKRGDRLEVVNLPFSGDKKFYGIKVSLWFRALIWGLLGFLIVWIIGFILLPMLKTLSRSFNPPPQHVSNSLLKQVERLCFESPDRALMVIRHALHQNQKGGLSYSPAAYMAIVLMLLEDSFTHTIMARLSPAEARQIGSLIGRLGRVPNDDIRHALVYFLRQAELPSELTGTPAQIRPFLSKYRPDGQALYSEMKLTENGQSIWDRIATIDLSTLVAYLKKQPVETTALILYHLPEALSGQIITLLPDGFAARLIVHLSHLKQIRGEAQEKLATRIAPAIYDLLATQKEFSGADKMAAILDTLTEQEQKNLILSVQKQEKNTAFEMTKRLMRWSDVLKLPDSAIQKLLRYCDKTVMAIALSDVPVTEQAIFARQMMPSVWQSVQNLMKRFEGNNTTMARDLIVKTTRELNLFPMKE